MLKKINLIVFLGLMVVGVNAPAFAEEVEFVNEEYVADTDTQMADQLSVNALSGYDESGSLFERITMLEQEKVVVQLEKERAQLDLDLED